ncbi:MAG: glycosyltransferase family 9 protein [Candidatus Krumholzibacteria bacterium]|nr:glycosyltransferase family 9 protein [Candidatus Krumholzibacteria bacterium]
MNIDRGTIGKILVIKLRAVGDVILSTAVLPNLRAAFPDATIDFLAERSCRDVIEGNDQIDNLIVFSKTKTNGARILLDLRRAGYDMVIDLFGNPRSALMTFASRARYRVGYDFRGRSYAYNLLVKPRGAEVHNVEFNLDALRRIGVSVTVKSPHFPLAEADREFAGREAGKLGLTGRPVIGINPGTNRPTERWPAGKFAELGALLAGRLDARICVFWGPGEKPLADAIAERIGDAAVVAPPTSLKQLGAMFERCSLVVSNDTGPMHIAAALGVPTVGIFGPVNPLLQGPCGENARYVRRDELSCLGCNYDKTCPIGNPCMTELEAEKVYHVVEDLIVRCDLGKRAVR